MSDINKGTGMTKADLILSRLEQMARQNSALEAKVNSLMGKGTPVQTQGAASSQDDVIAKLSKENSSLRQELSYISVQVESVYNSLARSMRQLSDEAVLPLLQAVRHLDGEVHLLKGFVRFSEFEGMLAGEIRPRNRVLPLLRRHFCSRFYNETFLLYDRTHHEALIHQKGKWAIIPLESFQMAAPSAAEAQYRRLWKRFYDTIEIRERHNPKLRRTHMPQRYWDTMTEFQGEDYFTAADSGAPEPPALAEAPGGGAPSPLLRSPAAPPSPAPGP